MSLFVLRLADYTRYPCGRFIDDGPGSAELFRTGHLVPALEIHYQVILDLNGVYGFPASWTEEVFGGLVRHHGYTPADLKIRLVIDISDDLQEFEIWQFIEGAG